MLALFFQAPVNVTSSEETNKACLCLPRPRLHSPLTLLEKEWWQVLRLSYVWGHEKPV